MTETFKPTDVVYIRKPAGTHSGLIANLIGRLGKGPHTIHEVKPNPRAKGAQLVKLETDGEELDGFYVTREAWD